MSAFAKLAADARNTGHGHVRPRPDGVKARCGGPGLCPECSRDAAGAFANAGRWPAGGAFATPTLDELIAAGSPLDELETKHPTLSTPRTERTLVAFTGLAGAGKSTAALHLVNAHGWQRLRFAGPLKSMLEALGLSGREIEGDLKEQPCALLCGRTPRHAMQTIGTEWGRELIGEDVWIRAWRAAFERTLSGSCIVVDDCRFPNEAVAVKAAGGLIIRIDRPGAGAGAAGHKSEGQGLPVDRVIKNDGSIDQLSGEVDALARDVSWVAAGTR